MQKVYLLLRNNSQTGPFSLDELLQFDLKPFDLIWIEGKSAGWYYPQEIEPLRPHLPFLKKAEPQPAAVPPQSAFVKTEPSAPKKIFVSMPSAATAAPKEEAVQPAQTRTLSVEQMPSFINNSVQSEPEVKTTYAKTLNEVETDYMNWAYQKKAKKKPVFSKSGLVVLCLVAAALFATWKFANKPKTEEPVEPLHQPVAGAQTISAQTETAAAEKQPSQKANNPLSKKERIIKKNGSVKNTTAILSQPGKNKPAAVAVNNGAKDNGDNRVAPPAEEETKPVAEEKKEAIATTETPKEKKTLGDKIRDIFKKKPDEKKEEAKPAEEENGARQSTRRETGSSLAQLVKVSFEIPNSWMMGIKGAKATLTNKSTETLAKAVVELRYYNDDNELLERKTIAFNNVKSKQSQTVSVPEHNTATRLEYSVVSAVGNEPMAFLRR